MAQIQFQFYHYKARSKTSIKGMLSFGLCASPAEKYISGPYARIGGAVPT